MGHDHGYHNDRHSNNVGRIGIITKKKNDHVLKKNTRRTMTLMMKEKVARGREGGFQPGDRATELACAVIGRREWDAS